MQNLYLENVSCGTAAPLQFTGKHRSTVFALCRKNNTKKILKMHSSADII